MRFLLFADCCGRDIRPFVVGGNCWPSVPFVQIRVQSKFRHINSRCWWTCRDGRTCIRHQVAYTWPHCRIVEFSIEHTLVNYTRFEVLSTSTLGSIIVETKSLLVGVSPTVVHESNIVSPTVVPASVCNRHHNYLVSLETPFSRMCSPNISTEFFSRRGPKKCTI